MIPRTLSRGSTRCSNGGRGEHPRDELARKLNLPQFTPRRAEMLVGGINEGLGEDTVTEMSRRGWTLTRYENTPITLSL
jgi:hypothetical protein